MSLARACSRLRASAQFFEGSRGNVATENCSIIRFVAGHYVQVTLFVVTYARSCCKPFVFKIGRVYPRQRYGPGGCLTERTGSSPDTGQWSEEAKQHPTFPNLGTSPYRSASAILPASIRSPTRRRSSVRIRSAVIADETLRIIEYATCPRLLVLSGARKSSA